MIRVFWHTALPAAPENPTIQTVIDQLQAGYWKDYSLVMAGATLGTIPLLILFFFFGRQLVAGVMAGAVKG